MTSSYVLYGEHAENDVIFINDVTEMSRDPWYNLVKDLQPRNLHAKFESRTPITFGVMWCWIFYQFIRKWPENLGGLLTNDP